MKELIEQIKQTFEDEHLSKTERQALRKLISEQAPNKRELAWLRSQIFDFAKEKISGYYNIQTLDWLEGINKLILPKLYDETYCKAYFSPGNECVNAIIEQISKATKSIDICVFTISDNRIKDKLIFKNRLGIKIKIITDNDKVYDAGSDIKTLANEGIEVKVDNSPNHMHDKFAVFDQEIILSGSYNWTRSAALYNQENIIVSNDQKLLNAFSQEFTKLWKQMMPYQ